MMRMGAGAGPANGVSKLRARLENMANSKAAPHRVQRHRAARPVVIIGALLIVASLIYFFVSRRGEHRPTLINGPQTDAVQVWKDETGMLGRMRVSRMMADNRNDFAEAHRWDAKIEAQETKVDRARQQKELLAR
jgi:hypothetical protein